jgi:uncharacterized caspase-like protein
MTPPATRLAAASLATALLVLAAWPSAGATVVQRYALVIGVGSYARSSEVPRLPYTSVDAQAVADLLQGQGYSVETLVDSAASRRAVVFALSRLAGQLRPEDSLVIFVTGHTVRNAASGNGYLLTYDSALDALETDAIRLTHLVEYIMEIRANHKLVLLDLCFSGDLTREAASPRLPLSTGPGRPGSDPPLTLRRGGITGREIDALFGDQQGEALIVASSADAAHELPALRHSVFAAALLDAFNTLTADTNGDRVLVADELLAFLPRRVKELSRQFDVPQAVTSLTPGGSAASWELARLADVSREPVVRRYMDRLTRWERGGWITFETKIEAIRVLQLWEKAAAGGSLSDRDARILAEVRKHLDRASTAEEEEAVAGSMETTLRFLLKQS